MVKEELIKKLMRIDRNLEIGDREFAHILIIKLIKEIGGQNDSAGISPNGKKNN